MPEISALAKRVKAYRESLGETQFELFGEIGISIEELSLSGGTGRLGTATQAQQCAVAGDSGI